MKAFSILIAASTVAITSTAWSQGSGPDASKSNIVSPQEQQKQLDAKHAHSHEQGSSAAPQASGTAPAAGGIGFKPTGGSGPDKNKANIVSKDEAKRQQGAAHRQGGNSQTSDGTGGSDGGGSGGE